MSKEYIRGMDDGWGLAIRKIRSAAHRMCHGMACLPDDDDKVCSPHWAAAIREAEEKD